MKVDVKIERLVLNGVELSRRERDALGPAIGRELAGLTSASARPAGDRRQTAGSKVDGIAHNIATEVYGAIAPVTASTRTRR